MARLYRQLPGVTPLWGHAACTAGADQPMVGVPGAHYTGAEQGAAGHWQMELLAAEPRGLCPGRGVPQPAAAWCHTQPWHCPPLPAGACPLPSCGPWSSLAEKPHATALALTPSALAPTPSLMVALPIAHSPWRHTGRPPPGSPEVAVPSLTMLSPPCRPLLT